MGVNKWISGEQPSPSDAPRMILDGPAGASFRPLGKKSSFRKADGRFARITDVRAYAEESGWIDDSGTDLLYVSSGNDSRPLFTLTSAQLEEFGVDGAEAPSFFVLVDHSHPEQQKDPSLKNPVDSGVEIILEESDAFDVARWPANLLFLTVTRGNSDPRRIAVLRIKASNEEVGILAEAESWSPRWFVGICDGCNGCGGQIEDDRARGEDGLHLRCENQVAERFHSIPLNLGSKFWLTDHIRLGTQEIKPFRGEKLATGDAYTVPTGQSLRLIHHWPDFPQTQGGFGNPSLYEVIPRGDG